jgi:NADH-quinone oxidoreductase subunit A
MAAGPVSNRRASNSVLRRQGWQGQGGFALRPSSLRPKIAGVLALRRHSPLREPAGSVKPKPIMQSLLLDYLPLVIFIGLSLVIGLALMIAPFAVAYKNPDPEKLSAYECGFNAFDDARMKFDVRFYLVAILFIIFDLEVAFLFPWAVALKDIGAFGFWSMMAFLFVLTVGFVYEWKKGALEWD